MTRVRLLPALLLVAVAACDETVATLEPPVADDEPALAVGMELAAVSHRFLRCPTHTTRSVTRTLGPLGGSMELDGHRFVLPPAAVLLPTTFTLSVPASEHVEVEVHAEGRDRFYFLLPATVTMSYSRCGDLDVDHDDLGVWYLGSLTGRLLEFMGGAANADRQEITFNTGHLSGFIIAN